jgi:hypothetical protein
MTLDGKKHRHGSAAAMSAFIMSVIVAVLAVRLLFSDERMVRLAGVIVLIVAASLVLFSCWRLFRSTT